MSGHSKWHSIKHKKAASDAKRGQIFTKLTAAISVAAKEGGGDLTGNNRLRLAVEAAKAVNMPNANIERAIKRGTGETAGATIESLTLEAFGPGGAAILIEAVTDNKNRTLASLRAILSKGGGRLAETGAVRHLFSRKGILRAEYPSLNDEIEEAIIDSGADDYHLDDGELLVTTGRDSLHAVRERLAAAGLTFASAELAFVPEVKLSLNEATSQALLALLDRIDDNEDVISVTVNADI